jgi:hypothetical protein
MSEFLPTGMDYVRASNEDQFIYTKFPYLSYESAHEELLGIPPTLIEREDISFGRVVYETYNYTTLAPFILIQSGIFAVANGIKKFTAAETSSLLPQPKS